MKHNKQIMLIALLLGVLTHLTGCSEPDKADKKPNADLVDGKHCYKNEYPFDDDSGAKDVMELNIIVQGDAVTGSYNWLPAYKDQRTGAFEGAIKQGVIEADYVFMQEGKEAEADIEIKLLETEAVVKSSAVELGLSSNIEKVKCSD